MIFSHDKSCLQRLGVSLLLVGTLASTVPAFTQDQTAPTTHTAPDNSAKNKHHNTTADQQKETTGDRDITRKIRQSIIADKSLSMYAHNVKIITVNGGVTLKGPVRSEEEKQKIADIASEATGSADKVVNKISIKP